MELKIQSMKKKKESINLYDEDLKVHQKFMLKKISKD
jgi:hypothetical protein